MPWELMLATLAGWIVALLAIVAALAVWSRALRLQDELDQERQKHGQKHERTWEAAARLRAQIDDVAQRITRA